MSRTDILTKVYELKDKLLNSEEYKNVKEKERLMEENCNSLLIKYNYLFNEYNQALRFKDYGSDVTKAQRELNECKKELDNNEYVKEYRSAYKKMTKLLNDVEMNIFQNLIDKKYINID